MAGIGSSGHKRAWLDRFQALLTHHTPDPVPTRRVPLVQQFKVDPPRAIFPAVPPKHFVDLLFNHVFLSSTRLLFCPSIKRTFINLQMPQNLCPRIPLHHLFNHLIPCFHFSREKMLKAFFKMSRSISSCRFLALSSITSCSNPLAPDRLADFHLCSRFSPIPKLSATERTVCPPSIILNALRLKSSSYLRRPLLIPL